MTRLEQVRAQKKALLLVTSVTLPSLHTRVILLQFNSSAPFSLPTVAKFAVTFVKETLQKWDRE